MKHTRNELLCSLLALGVAAGLSSCSTTPSAQVDTKASSVLQAMSDKLAAAKTLRVTATREASPGFHVGFDVAEKAKVSVALQRPNKVNAVSDSNLGKRLVSYDGSTVTFVDVKAGTHAQLKAEKDIDSTARALENTYSVMPPLVELLANNPKAFLLEGVTGGESKGTEVVAGATCDHLAFKQAELSWELWVNTADHLPKKMVITHPNGEGGAPLKVTLIVEKWELDAPVSAADLNLTLPKNSTRVEMIPLTNS